MWCRSPQWSSPALPLAIAWAQMSLLLLTLTEEQHVSQKPHINKGSAGEGGGWVNEKYPIGVFIISRLPFSPKIQMGLLLFIWLVNIISERSQKVT